MRLRLGSHLLNVVTGRWTDGGIAWAHRYCRKCMAYAVEDERRFFMQCPACQETRSKLTSRSCLMIVKVI